MRKKNLAKTSHLPAEPGITLEADMWFLVPVDGDDMSPGVPRLLELHAAHRAHVVLLLQRQVRVCNHLNQNLLLFGYSVFVRWTI